MLNVLLNGHGAVIINKLLAIDGHDDCVVRVVTHAHSDHLIELDKSVSKCKGVIGTPLTIEWINELNHLIPSNKAIKLEYEHQIKIDDVVVLLKKSHHIPGASQVVITDSDGLRIVYTSDFKRPGSSTPIVESDILILDAVYGHPTYVRSFDDHIDEVLTDLVKQLLAKGPVAIYGYHGKLQEVMEILRVGGVIAPYVLPSKVYRLTKVAERYGLKIGDYFLYDSDEGVEAVRSGWFITFNHVSSRNLINDPKVSHIILSGWEFKKPYRYLGRKRWLIAFSDHADFNGLINYVVNSNPRTIIVNSVRSSYPEIFAKEVRRITGKECIAMPS